MLTLAALEHRDALLCLAIERKCREAMGVVRGSRLWLAVSGGADSCALALIMSLLKPRLELRLSAVHVNHLLRTDAERDEQHVASLCGLLQIPCVIRRIDVRRLADEKGCGVEEAGREARYSVFRELAQSEPGSLVMLAHHADDLLEDVLMRLLRGAGWPGLAGMREKDGFIARPLLGYRSARLKALLQRCDIAWREDASNNDLAFLRNRVRHRIVPLLLQENPALRESVLNLKELASQDEQFWRNYLQERLQLYPWYLDAKNLRLPTQLLHSMETSGRLRLYRLAIRTLALTAGVTLGTPASTLLKLERCLQNRKYPSVIQIPGSCAARVDRHGIIFSLAGRGERGCDSPGSSHCKPAQ